MPQFRSFVKYWLPVILWMMVIFSASGDSHSYEHSSRIIAPLVKFFFPNISPKTLEWIELIARKCAHLSEYAVLALLFWRAARKPVRRDPRPWSWRLGLAAIVFVFLYASTDEFHQRFVPTREPSVHDVMIDTTGAAIGIFLLWGTWCVCERYSSRNRTKCVRA